MATRIRTLNFLPEIFQTPTNSQFLGATLDVLVDQPQTKTIEGYIGSKFGYGINAKDYYVTEPTKTRTDYQLDPGVVFTKSNETTAQDFISYPGIIDSLKVEGANVENNSDLFSSEFYSWDSFSNLDKLINYNQYYWIPEGPERVVVSTEIIFNVNDYLVTSNPGTYSFSTIDGINLGTNPTLTLLRGGIYSFAVNQDSQFWIQGEPGVTGFSASQPNLQTRDVYGVSNNGANVGIVTFQVPFETDQDQYNFPGNNPVDLVSTIPFAQINGVPVSEFAGIDGVTSLNGLRILFYNTGVANEEGYTSSYFDEVNYDINNPLFNSLESITITQTDTDGVNNWCVTSDTSVLTVGQTITFGNPALGGIVPGQVYYVKNILDATKFTISITLNGTQVGLINQSGTMPAYINEGLWEEGYYSFINDNFYVVEYIGDPNNPVIRLVPDGSIPINQKITATYGTQYVNRSFYKNPLGTINIIPYISAPLDTLYYQDGTTSGKVGIIRLIENNVTNTLDVENEILGKTTFTAPNGVVFTNGLKVSFEGDVIPSRYLSDEYYVEGVGTAIELIPVSELVVPEPFTESVFIPYDTTPYDSTNWEGNSFIPVLQDYITIARNSINKNPWSRSNRWFHIDVINATAQYNNDPSLVSLYAVPNNKAKRPIIEFYPNLKLFDSGSFGKNAIDFIDFRTTDAFSNVAGQENYYPDVTVYTEYNTTITSVSITPIIAASMVVGQTYKIDSLGTTDWNVIAGTSSVTYNVGDVIVCIVVGTGTGTGIQLSTNLSVANTSITGTFEIGQYVADSTNQLPPNSIITNVVTSTSTTTITISWEFAVAIAGTSLAQVIGTDTTVDNYALFDGSRVVFANDNDLLVRNKIYVSRFSTLSTGGTPVITLTEAEDGNVLENDQLAVFRGYNYEGKDFWFNGDNWILGQQKTNVNQPPLFDVFDSNGISFSDNAVYSGTSFRGSKLFAYALGSGIDDIVLGFPIKYSSVDNVGDISFDVSLNSETFNYVSGTTPITKNVNTGYVYNYTTREIYTRQLGWQTAVAPSVQYQLFSFDYTLGYEGPFICDVVPTSPSIWPNIQVFINNKLQDTNSYSVAIGQTSTSVFLNTVPVDNTVIQIIILSSQVSNNAYFTIPINLNNNPFNQNLTSVNVGDIRGQYQSIFYNNPNTTGEVFGPNNYRDLGNLVPWGNKIIQNSASLVLPGTLLRKQNLNLFQSLTFNNREYIKFKTVLIDTVQKTIFQQTFNPSQMLDQALDVMSSSKTQSQPFFWSDMLPSKAALVTNTYSFANSLDVSVYPLTKIYNFTSANYNGLLVYLTRSVSGVTSTTQLLIGQDYVVSTTAPSLTVTENLLPGDLITIKEYNQTYGSYCPNTPTKLGLYPSFIPEVILDSNYFNPTYFILGHDGSYTKLYGDYDPVTGVLVDFRDQVLLEFEKRIYNNLKLDSVIPIQEFEVIPGYFRSTPEDWEKFTQIYSTTFLDWVGTNRVDYKTQFYNKTNSFTFNYRGSGNKLDQAPLLQGYWRGVYQYFYDTTTPDSTPWEMLGYKNQPSWWITRYGPAPYTSDNLLMWEDLSLGYDYNNGNPRIIEQAIRPGLLDIIPVDSAGYLLAPFDSIMGNYIGTTFRNDWAVGDMGPTELSYRRSSSWPFDLMRIMALTKPANFYNLAVDLDNYKFNTEFNQYLVNDRSHLIISDIQIYGDGTAKTSYLNWVVDFEKQFGINSTENLLELFKNLDVRLVYRLAGFSDKNLLKFYVEKGTPNSRNASLLIPDESYQVLLYDNQPFDKIVYSGIIIQIVPYGYSIFGNAQNYAYFKSYVAKPSARKNLSVENLSVQVPTEFYSDTVVVPYGTTFLSIQDLTDFIMGYGKFLQESGMRFDEIENGIEINWEQMVAELLYWAQTGWEQGSIVTLNPAAKSLKIDKESYVVQPLTIQNDNFVLNENLYPIQAKDLSILREGVLFNVKPLNQGDSIGYGQFFIQNLEHGIVFNNETLFGDKIYNLITGLRQNRISVRGVKTAEWNGTMTTPGFIYNQDNIKEWSRELKYTKGQIVKYKNKFWTALRIIQAKEIFDERDWKETEYDQIQKGLLPNPSTRSFESTLYYNVDRANLEQDTDLLSFSLIGYRPRDYLALADLTDITQVNVYKNLIKNKGTLNSASAFKGANLPQGGIDYDIYENWAIKSAEFGGVLNSNFVEFKLNQNLLTGNPSIVSLNNGVYTTGAQQEVSIHSLFNYNRPIDTPYILPTVPANTPNTLYPDAGYVNLDDVKLSSFYYSQLPIGVNKANTIVPINNVYVRDFVWLANYQGSWQILTPSSLGQIIAIRNNLNNTITITLNSPQNLNQYDPVMIVNFDDRVNGYYIVNLVIDPYNFIVNFTLDSTIKSITGNGILMQLESQRVTQPSDIGNLPLLNAEFRKNKVWVDFAENDSWAVYEKSLNYTFDEAVYVSGSQTFGSAVAFTNQLGYLIGDASAGIVRRYTFNTFIDSYEITQTITQGTSFGSNIAYAQDIFVITEPDTTTVYIYQLQNSVLSDSLVTYQPGITTTADNVAISGDKKWIYISDLANNSVHVYRQDYLPTVAGSFTVGQTYIISDAGTTDFIAIGATSNEVGTAFVASGAGTGTGSATQSTYSLATTIDADSLGLTTAGDNFGYSLSTNYYGDILAVGAPDQNTNTGLDNYGYSYVFNRLVQNIEVQFTSTSAQQFNLVWTPPQGPTRIASSTTATEIVTNNTISSSYIGFPVIFSGTNVNTIAGSFINGITYRITSIGTTDFTLIGAASNTVGLSFTATGAGSGTGTALLVENYGASGINPNTVYYISAVSGNNLSVSLTKGGTAIALTISSGLSFHVYIQTTPIYVSVNGQLVNDNNYAVANNTLIYTTALNAGDIINVSGQEFELAQVLSTEQTPQVGVQFGHGIDTTIYGTEIIVGAPFNLNQLNQEGAVYRFTNFGGRYGSITGTTTLNLTTSATILINGFSVTLPAGNVIDAVSVINSANITNITSSFDITQAGNFIIGETYQIVSLNTGTGSVTNFTLIGAASNTIGTSFIATGVGTGTGTATKGILTISLIDNSLAPINNKLMLVAVDYAKYSELGINTLTQTQIVNCPHLTGPTQFGYSVKFNEFDSFVASAPTGTRYESTTFDFSDDNIDNDTIFDNNATIFVDTAPNAGAVYMFDYLPANNENASNVGKFVYAQSVNDNEQDYGYQPYYGQKLDFNENHVIIGAPNFKPNDINGQVVVYQNLVGDNDWSVYRQSSEIVDINRINNSQIFSAESNTTLINLDYIDPLQGKILGVARENIDVVSNDDPARYNSNGNVETSTVWGANHLGQLWLNTTGMRFINYHQNDLVYNSRYWGALFPNSDVAVYSWVASNLLPVNYTGPGIPFDVTKYSIQYELNNTGTITPVYYYWVRNTNIIYTKFGKTLSDTVIELYIKNPQGSGISYFAPLLSNTIGLYNSQQYINDNDSVYHISYATGYNDDVAHNEYTLIRTNYKDDFLPGLPGVVTNPISTTNSNVNLITGGEPYGLYNKLLDSLSGVNIEGGIIPDPYLPKAVQFGVLNRPRQSFFLNRFNALKNYIGFSNEVLKLYPISEIKQFNFLFDKGLINPSTVGNPNWTAGPELFYDTTDYWEYINWWAVGYDDNTKSNVQVQIYADLSTLNAPVGTIATVVTNGNGLSETYLLDTTRNWVRIGLENGTIRIKDTIYDYATARIGFGDNFFDTDTYSDYPSQPTRNIIRALNEEIFVDELLTFRNKGLILLFEYIQSETIENQNYLPWLNKTSFIDVAHTIRELLPFEVFKSDNQDFLAGYLNEIKPFHVVIKEFLFVYKRTDVFEGDITDFDLPAQFNTDLNQFISPSLVYQNVNSNNEFSVGNEIWQTQNYLQWFNNYGLNLSGQENYKITELASDITNTTTSFVVENASGFPVNGIIKIQSILNNQIVTEEIRYNDVDLSTNVISQITRGFNGTPILNHLSGQSIYIDLPPALVLNSGRGYLNPPRIIAYYDPAITQSAQFTGSISGTTLTITEVQTGEIIVGNYISGNNITYGTQIVTLNDDGTYEINVSQIVNSQQMIQYVGPKQPAILQAVMGFDQVLSIDIVQAGTGYPAQPEIIIDPSLVVTFANTDVDLVSNTIRLYAPTLQTGDLVQYKVGENTVSVGGLIDKQWYYINVLETSPIIVVALYEGLLNALNDTHRIEFYSTGSGLNNTINLGAKATSIVNSQPIRENITTIKFDRTTYNSEVIDWEAGRYYGSFYAGQTYSSGTGALALVDGPDSILNSTISTTPGVAFEIVDARNEQVIDYDSVVRSVEEIIAGNYIRLNIAAGVVEETASASTLGFTLGMPIKFFGEVIGTGLATDTEYYIYEIANETDFKVSSTPSLSSPVVLTPTVIGSAGLFGYPGKVTNTAIISVYYPGIRTVTESYANTNKLRIPLNPTGTGGTNGMTVGTPVFFTNSDEGSVFGNIVENDNYYVTTVCDLETFTISRTNDPLIINIVSASNVSNTITVQTNTDGLAINDPIIFSNFTFDADEIIAGYEYKIVTLGTTDWNTIAGTAGVDYAVGDTLTASAAGTGTGVVSANNFSNIQAGTVYYVNELVGLNSLKIATGINLSSLAITDSLTGSGNLTSQTDTYNLTTSTGEMLVHINLPVSPGQVNGQKFTLYKTASTPAIYTIDDTQYTILQSSLISRPVGATISATNIITIQQDSDGLENFYVNMPIEFDSQVGNLTTGTTYYVLDTGTITVSCTNTNGAGYITCISTTNLYINMPIVFSGTGLGNIILGTTYYVRAILSGTTFEISSTVNGSVFGLANATGTMEGTGDQYIQVDTVLPPVSAIDPGNSQITVTIAAGSYPGNAVVTVAASSFTPANGVRVSFKTSGTMPTGLVENTVYYIVNSTGPTTSGGTFKLSNDLGGAAINISAAGSGIFTMLIADEISLTQDIISNPILSISYVLGQYSVGINDAGSGWAIGNKILVSGNNLGGNYSNNLTLTVNEINAVTVDPVTGDIISSDGKIIDFTTSGVVPGISDEYYFKVLSYNEFALYENSKMTIPVNGLTLGFDGITSTTATAITAANDRITVTSSVDFADDDPVVFTGTIFSNQINLGQQYYIFDKPTSTTVRIKKYLSDIVPINFSSNTSGSMTMAKIGDYALLPEPFYFNASIVKFNKNAYICIVSNNDTEFIIGKWLLLSAGNNILNAMDRVKVYYQPTDNMPGVNLPQLFTGLEYPNSTYLGNRFAPGETFPLDTILPITAFTVEGLDFSAITFDGDYKAIYNTTSTGLADSTVGSLNWVLSTLATLNVQANDIIYANSKYVIATSSQAVPIYKSTNGSSWSNLVTISPIGSTNYLNSVTYKDSIYTAVGNNIITSTNLNNWVQVFAFTGPLTNELNGVVGANISGFDGVIAVGKGQRYDYTGPLTQILDTNIILVSNDNINFTQLSPLSFYGLNTVTYGNNILVAAGENGIIYISSNGNSWQGVTEIGVLNTNGATNEVTVLSVDYINVGDILNLSGQNFGGLTTGVDYYVGAINTGTNSISLFTDAGFTIPVVVSTASPVGVTNLYIPNTTINKLYYDDFNGIFIGIGNRPNPSNPASEGIIITSPNGTTWTSQTSNVTEDLFGITSDGLGNIVVVGNNNTIIESNDAGVTWTLKNTFTLIAEEYNIQGDSFTAGYGPEELVPGVVTDTLNMLVNTRPGTNWSATKYGHVGYNVNSIELTPSSGIQTVYSFLNVVQTPAQLFVAVMDATTLLSTTIYNGIDYTVNWINSEVILNSALSAGQKLRIDVYEIGNGDQLVKSNSLNEPIRYDSETEFSEIYLDCNYAATIAEGSGVTQIGTGLKYATILATEADTNTITCESVTDFSINDPITFQGAVFGGLNEDTEYYVKTISYVTNTITVSTTFNFISGTAGPTYVLSTATGTCFAIINIGNGIPYTDPIVYANGTKLVHGVTGIATRTKSATNTIQVNSTAGFIINGPITFSASMFGGITPNTVYYIRTIISEASPLGPNEFTISTTPGGAIIALPDDTGFATFITNDYAFGLQPNNIQAKIIFATTYDQATDYLSFTVFGETTPIQYGYAVPETQIYTGDNVTNTFALDNYISNASVNNAIVEINGLRQNAADYTIDNSLDLIVFDSAPAAGAKVAITTYNDTNRQYLATQFGITSSPGSVITSITVRRTINQNTSYGAYVDSINLIIGQEYVINTVGTSDFTLVGAGSNIAGTIFTAGLVTTAGSFTNDNMYLIQTLGTTDFTLVGADQITAGDFVVDEEYIIDSVGSTDFTLIGAASNTVGVIFTATGAGSGTGTAIVTVFKASGVGAGTGTATCFGTTGTGTVEVGYDGSSGSPVTVNAGSFSIGEAYEITVLGTTDWNIVAGTTGYTYNVGDIIIADNVGSGTGQAQTIPSSYGGSNLNLLILAQGDTSVLTVNDKIEFSNPTIGGLLPNYSYYVTSIINSATFTISTTIGGTDVNVDNDTGLMISSAQSVNVANIISISNSLTPILDDVNVASTNATGSIIVTSAATTNFVVGQTVQFKVGAGDVGFGGIEVNGKVYYVRGVEAPYITNGNSYTITSIGTTDFTLIGAASNTVGVTFIATGPGTGTGQALGSNEFCIEDEFGNQISLTTVGSPPNAMIAYVGGVPAVRVTTGIPHKFATNDLVRIDGTTGSTQLNNNVFYVHVINSLEFDLYQYFSNDPSIDYDPTINAINYPITVINSYTGGGYCWIDGLFVISSGIAESTTEITNIITLATGYTTTDFVANTPIYFTESSKQVGDTTLGSLVIGHRYYVKEIVSATEFTVASSSMGSEVELINTTVTAGSFDIGKTYIIESIGSTNFTLIGSADNIVGTIFTASGIGSGTGTARLYTEDGAMNCTQWEQDDVDRLYVTVNGLRVPSSKLRLNPANFVSILTEIVSGDIVTISSMIPSATPNQESYLLNVNKNDVSLVNRVNDDVRTWLTSDVYPISAIIYVENVGKITRTTIQTSTTPAAVAGFIKIGLTADKNIISSISVYNQTTSTLIASSNYSIVVEGLVPVLKITTGGYISTSDILEITIIEGNLIYINGEEIKFTTVNPLISAGSFVVGKTYQIETLGTTDFTLIGAASNTLGISFVATGVGTGTGKANAMNAIYGLTRGVNGTGVSQFLNTYTEVFGLLTINQLSATDYLEIWNSYEYGQIPATQIETGQTYVIQSVGTTDFTLIGASANLVGLYFVATAIGTGTGQVTATNNADPLQISNTAPAIFLQRDP